LAKETCKYKQDSTLSVYKKTAHSGKVAKEDGRREETDKRLYIYTSHMKKEKVKLYWDHIKKRKDYPAEFSWRIEDFLRMLMGEKLSKKNNTNT